MTTPILKTFDAPLGYSGVQQLSDDITINGQTESPAFVYRGIDANYLEWNALVGSNIDIAGTGDYPDLQVPAFGNSASDAAVRFNCAAYYESSSTSYGNIVGDAVIEVCLATGTLVGSQELASKVDSAGLGWIVDLHPSEGLRATLNDGTSIVEVKTGILNAVTTYQAVLIIDSSGSAQWYLNRAVTGSAAVVSGLGTLVNTGFLRTGRPASLFVDGDMSSATVDDWDAQLTNTILSKTTIDPQAGLQSLRVESDTLAVDGGMEKEGVETLIDGNMEDPTTAAYIPLRSATLTKDTVNPHSGLQCLRIAYNGINSPLAEQLTQTIGKPYCVRGWAAGDGVSNPQFRDGSVTHFSGTPSTDWQEFRAFYIATSTSARFKMIGTSGYVRFDDVEVLDMTTATEDWAAVNSAFLCKEGTAHTGALSMKINYNGVSNPGAQPAVAPLTIGSRYRLTGWGAGDDGVVYPKVYEGANQIWSGVLSPDFQFFSLEFVATATTYTMEAVASAAGFARFDDINITKITNLLVDGDNTQTGSNKLQDGNMETVGVAAWKQANVILTKEPSTLPDSTQSLRITRNGGLPLAYQTINTIGQIYTIEGYARSDGTRIPAIASSILIWQGTNSTSWQPFKVTYSAASSDLVLRMVSNAVGYVEFDKVTVRHQNEATSNYTAATATLTKELDGTKQILRITQDSPGTPYGTASQTPLTTSQNFTVVGRARSDGNAIASINNASVSEWMSTQSTDWQDISFSFVASATDLTLECQGDVGEYVEFDYLRVFLTSGAEQLNPTAIFNQNLVVDSDYNFVGYGRSDGFNTSKIYDGTTVLWESTTATEWQAFDLDFTAISTELSLTLSTLTGRGGWDSASLKLFNVHGVDINRISLTTAAGWLDSHLQPVWTVERFDAWSGLAPRVAAGAAAGTFIRASSAYVHKYLPDSQSYAMLRVDNNTPRSGRLKRSASKVFEGLLVEQGATNTIAESEDLSTWTKQQVGDSVTPGFLAPNYAETAYSITYGGSAMLRGIYEDITLDGSQVQFSAWAKPGVDDWFAMSFNASGSTLVFFDLVNLVVGTTGSATLDAKIGGPYPGGWYRCQASMASLVGTNRLVLLMSSADGLTFSFGDAVNANGYIWGVQAEIGSRVSSYIYNTAGGGAGTRTAEILAYSAVDNVSESDVTFVADVITDDYTPTADSALFGVRYPSPVSVLQSIKDGDTALTFESDPPGFSVTGGDSITDSTMHAIRAYWSDIIAQQFVDSLIDGETESGVEDMGAPITIFIGSDTVGATQFNGWIANVKFYDGDIGQLVYGNGQSQEGDVLLYQTADDGDVTVVQGVTQMTPSFDTMVYLSLMGGNEDDPGGDDITKQWWGNSDVTEPAFQYRSETQYMLRSFPVTSSNLLLINQAVVRDLTRDFLDTKIANGLETTVTIPALNKVLIAGTITADGEEHSFSFVENWKASE